MERFRHHVAALRRGDCRIYGRKRGISGTLFQRASDEERTGENLREIRFPLRRGGVPRSDDLVRSGISFRRNLRETVPFGGLRRALRGLLRGERDRPPYGVPRRRRLRQLRPRGNAPRIRRSDGEGNELVRMGGRRPLCGALSFRAERGELFRRGRSAYGRRNSLQSRAVCADVVYDFRLRGGLARLSRNR